MKIFAILVGIIVSCFVVTVGTMDIAAAASYKVTPLVIDREVTPRDIITETITITNSMHYRMTVYATVNAVDVAQGGDILDYVPKVEDDRPRSITSWMSIPQAGTDIDPGETIEMQLRIQVDAKAEPGEYHAFIGFGNGRTRDDAITQVKAGDAPGVVVRLHIDTPQSSQLRLDTFVVDRFVFDANTQSVSYTIENPGETEVVPTGEIIFYNARGAEVGVTTVNPERYSLAPNEKKTLTTTAPADGLMGKYKAFLMVQYENSQMASVYDTTFFYIIPWFQLFSFLAVVTVVGLLLFMLLHRRYRKPTQADSHTSIPVYIYKGTSETQDHDINLKA